MAKYIKVDAEWREFLVSIAFGITIVAGVGIGYLLSVGYGQITEMQRLEREMQDVIQGTYRLATMTNHMLYTDSDIENTHRTWTEQFTRVTSDTARLAQSEERDYLPAKLNSGLSALRDEWKYTTYSITQAEAAFKDLAELYNRRGETTSLQRLSQSASPAPWARVYNHLRESEYKLRAYTENTLTPLQVELRNTSIERQQAAVRDASRATIGIGVLIASALLLAMQILSSSSQKNHDRTMAIKALLDAAEEGFFSFSKDRVIRPETSKACTEIFGGPIAGCCVEELVCRTDGEKKDYADAMALVFEDSTAADMMFGTMPQTLDVNGKTATMQYRVVTQGLIMGVIKDITEQEQRRKEQEDERENREMVLRVVTARGHFLSLNDEAESLAEGLDRYVSGEMNAPEVESLIRKLHTLKANAGFLKMRHTARIAHEIEDTMNDAQLLDDAEPIAPKVEDFKRALGGEQQLVKAAVGEHWLEDRATHEVDGALLAEIYNHAQEHHNTDQELLSKIERVTKQPMRRLFRQMAEMAPSIALSRGKSVVVTTTGGDIAAQPELIDVARDAINHIVRNAIDHAVEFPRQRERAGKPRAGEIAIAAHEDTEKLWVEIRDDGAGVDMEKVRLRAIEKGMLAADAPVTKRKIIHCMFSDGFTTRDEVTTTSGRGVGLSAVREQVRAIGGKINITTSKGKGTMFRITLPKQSVSNGRRTR